MLINLVKRSNEIELMDSEDLEESVLNIALSDISRVNKLLGGNSITIKSVFKEVYKIPTARWSIMDIGCGDGEMLRQIANYARKKKIKLQLIGIDTNTKCIDLAKRMSLKYPEIDYYTRDILTLKEQDFRCDIIICTLTLHHFSNTQIKKILQKSIAMVSTAIIINDIHRSIWSYYLFKLFSAFFIKGYVAKNDGLVSIKRGFKKRELIQFSKELQLKKYQLHWRWVFRYRWVIIK